MFSPDTSPTWPFNFFRGVQGRSRNLRTVFSTGGTPGLVRRFRAANVHRQITLLLMPLPKPLKHTSKLDNGKEFSMHGQLSMNADIDIYFARPHHAWERGSNARFNGLLRQSFLKGTDFTRLSRREVEVALNQLNDRPCKRLDYQTP